MNTQPHAFPHEAMSHDSQPFSPLPRSEDRPVAALDAPLDAATRRFDMDELTRYREANQQFRSGGVTRRSIERQAGSSTSTQASSVRS